MLRILSPLLWRNAHNPVEIPVERGQCGKSTSYGNIAHCVVCTLQFPTCCANSNPIDIFNRRHLHTVMKYPPQMRFTDMAHRSQFLHLDRTITTFADIVNRRCDQTAISRLSFPLPPDSTLPPVKEEPGSVLSLLPDRILFFPAYIQ